MEDLDTFRLSSLFHDDMEIAVNVGGLLSEPIKVLNGVKQGDLVAPSFLLFFIYLRTVAKVY